ncbi:MAG: Trp biosynthesis-associated membrane protein [Actinomycetia bacterium]|nr:Trp biosynthesis-associated membrane protein [Actinomycetes bacterium]
MTAESGAARRLYGPCVLAGIAAGAVMLFAGSRSWASAQVAPAGMTVDEVGVTGSTSVPLVSAMAFVVMAAAVAVVASGGWLRRAIGVLLVVAAGAAAVAILMAGSAIDDAVRDAVAASPSMTGGAAEQGSFVDAADQTVWRWIAFAGSLVAFAAGCAVVAYANVWPRMGSRYDAPTTPSRHETAKPTEDRDAADLWKAMDEGGDPTA